MTEVWYVAELNEFVLTNDQARTVDFGGSLVFKDRYAEAYYVCLRYHAVKYPDQVAYIGEL